MWSSKSDSEQRLRDINSGDSKFMQLCNVVIKEL